jgi:pilus assembly protein Flp/PilA
MRPGVHALLTDDRGATVVEYAVVAGFISMLIVAASTSIGTTLKGIFNSVATVL